MDVVLISLVGAIAANIIPIICYVLAIIFAKNQLKWKIPFWIGVAAGIIPMFGNISLIANQGVSLTGADIEDWILFAIITAISILLIKRQSGSSATPIFEESKQDKQVDIAVTLPQKDIPSSVTAKEKVDVLTDIQNGGWRCSNCGKAHYSYETSCSCGKSRFDSPPTVKKHTPSSAMVKEKDDVMTDVPNGGWRCSNCGKVHYSYETSCSCGKSRFDSAPTVKKKEAVIPTIDELYVDNSMNTVGQKDNTTTELSPFDIIRKFKELLDEGIITQEEFDAKKKQLLGL